MSSSSKALVLRFVDFVMKKSQAQTCFATSIIPDGSLGKLETRAKGVSFRYKVPMEVCRNKSMSVSSLLAIFDELSTYALIARCC